jgi:hypothetical protein
VIASASLVPPFDCVTLHTNPVTSTTKSGRHDIAEILLKVALNTKNQSIFTIHRNLDIANGGEKARLQRCTYILTPKDRQQQ